MRVNKVLEGRPHIVDAMANGEVQLVFNTTEGQSALSDLKIDPAGGSDGQNSVLRQPCPLPLPHPRRSPP